MKPIYIRHFSFRFEHPAKDEPSWKENVDRWYQLDAFAYGLAEAYAQWKSQLGPHPSLILLASPQASNLTDLQFAQTGAISPAKFVHTLPNIRCSPLCQVMKWTGSVLCLQKDPWTQVHALREGAALLAFGNPGPIWVMSAFQSKSPAKTYETQAFVLSPSSERATHKMHFNSQSSDLGTLQTDGELQEWLFSKAGTFSLPGEIELSFLERPENSC